ncbi:hypothetical protein GALMADRAFT_768977 [Galerina marginata CBS 339.88]|uniref:Uncharacterized protein n=1 Tax=Galerina marginata (strain CBS 339.88) TaxID=685588 RepID=A0A067SQJ0_GALM3|nr:hypothetical protein GALMADRAFT_768977 [Galerina marginata CBS 339.88]
MSSRHQLCGLILISILGTLDAYVPPARLSYYCNYFLLGLAFPSFLHTALIGLSLLFHLRPVSRCLVEGACWSSYSQFGYLHMLSLDILSFPSFVFLLHLSPPCRSTLMRYIALSYSNSMGS